MGKPLRELETSEHPYLSDLVLLVIEVSYLVIEAISDLFLSKSFAFEVVLCLIEVCTLLISFKVPIYPKQGSCKGLIGQWRW